jgi:hypothetical protein
LSTLTVRQLAWWQAHITVDRDFASCAGHCESAIVRKTKCPRWYGPPEGIREPGRCHDDSGFTGTWSQTKAVAKKVLMATARPPIVYAIVWSDPATLTNLL